MAALTYVQSRVRLKVLYGSSVSFVLQQRNTIISGSMPPAEIIKHLTEHGCPDLTDKLNSFLLSGQPVSHGGFGNVYLERLRDNTEVAIKALRVPFDNDDEADKLPKATRELYIWSKCRHRNVLPLLGLVVFKGQIRMVSKWVENGSLPSYLRKHPDTDRCNMSLKICYGVAYLHRTGVVSIPPVALVMLLVLTYKQVHGDLKGDNVLVSKEGVPMITDFGNAVLEQGSMQFTETTKQSGFTPRWTV
ncbi:hypothetical protein FRC09_018964 [Ceratobasidium sp. 395]|nr:hypothetical protein FRC09_018964 [Ceratobasidium sp. 395]